MSQLIISELHTNWQTDRKVKAECYIWFSSHSWVDFHHSSISPPSFHQGRHHPCGVHHLPQRELVFALPGTAGRRCHMLPQASAHCRAAGTHSSSPHRLALCWHTQPACTITVCKWADSRAGINIMSLELVPASNCSVSVCVSLLRRWWCGWCMWRRSVSVWRGSSTSSSCLFRLSSYTHSTVSTS